MEILNFIPLFLWALGVPVIDSVLDIRKAKTGCWTKDDVKQDTKENAKYMAHFWFWGVLFWLFIAIQLTFLEL